MNETELERMIVRLMGDSSNYEAMLRRAEMFTTTATDHIIASAQKTAAVMATLSAAIAGVGMASLASFSQFESDMAKLQGLVGQSQAQVNQWTEQLLTIAPSVGKTPDELAKAMFFITSAGIRGSKALEVLTVVAKASSAGLGDIGVIANATTSAVNSYSKSNLSAAQATDIMVATIREGKLEASSLGPVLGKLLPVASSMKVDFAEVSGAIAAMSRTGSNAAEAATSLQWLLVGLQKPSEKATGYMKAAGISFQDLRDMVKKPGGLIEALRLLDKTFGGDEEALSHIIPNVRSLRGAMTLLGQDMATVNGVMEDVRNSTGSTDRAFKVMTSTLAFRLNQGRAALQVIGIEVAKVLLPALDRVAEILTGALGWWQGLSQGAKETIILATTLVGAFMGLSPAMRVFGFFLSGLDLFSITAVAIAGSVAFLISKTGEWAAMWELVKQAAFDVLLFIADTLSELGTMLKPVGQAIASAMSYAWDLLKQVLINIGPILYGMWDGMIAGAKYAGKAISEVTSLLNSMGKGSVLQWIKEFYTANQDLVIGVLSSIAAIYVAIGAYNLFSATLGIVLGIMQMLGLQQVIGIAMWIATKAVVASYIAVLIAYQVTQTAITILYYATMAAVSATLGVMAIFTGVISLTTVATWLLNAAVAAFNILMAPTAILAFLATLGLVIAAFVLLTAVVGGVIGAVKGAIEAVMQLPVAYGPIAKIGSLIGEWVTILKDVYSVATTDLPAAWELLSLGFALAVAQVKDLWPPLWEFIKSGSSAIWKYIASEFETSLTQSIVNTGKSVNKFWNDMGFATKKSDSALEKMFDTAIDKSVEAGRALTKSMGDAISSFKVNESEATKDARKAVDKATNSIKDKLIDKAAENWMESELGDPFADKLTPQIEEQSKRWAEAYDKGIVQPLKKARHEAEKFDAATKGSTEAAARVMKYLDNLRDLKKPLDAATKNVKDSDVYGKGVSVAAPKKFEEELAVLDAATEKMPPLESVDPTAELDEDFDNITESAQKTADAISEAFRGSVYDVEGALEGIKDAFKFDFDLPDSSGGYQTPPVGEPASGLDIGSDNSKVMAFLERMTTGIDKIAGRDTVELEDAGLLS